MIAIHVDRPTEDAFDVVVDPRSWWSASVEGDAGCD